MEVITSQLCTGKCKTVRPMQDFRFLAHSMRYRTQCRSCESDASMDRQRKRKEAGKEWTDAEIGVLHELYPVGGSSACKPYLPNRTRPQIQDKARYDGISYSGPSVSGSPSKENQAWGLPTHDYCEADIAMRAWKAAMPVVGTFLPSMGMARAAA
jgi:hypothetical protein